MAPPSESKQTTRDCSSFRVDPRDDPLDCISIFALVVLACGIILVSAGYLVPRDHAIDPKLSARENEQLGLHYAKLASDLDICIITGMVFVGLGGVTMAVLLIAVLCRGELNGSPQPKRPSYGARETTESSSTRQLFQMADVENAGEGR
ncbi:transmembrane protein 74B-like [Lineus longissimus]|uniref:transmembrane protein 74B-like n=1 Tax=Lineus longissimus TaxID=88925 RepID=UPI00315C9AFE